MYANYYSLKKEPFHITPDPEFLYLSPSHKEALGSIIYGIRQRKGFILITGEVGVGKTTIIRSFLEQSDNSRLKVIYLFNPNVSFAGLLKNIFRELDMLALTDDVFELVNQLHEVLIAEYRKGSNVVLIIDEAQNMPVETLENLRMLSNLETSKDKLIQIVFSGQPEFGQKLELNVLRQLKQRIAVRSTILPLSAEESLAYIRHRLAKASSVDDSIFDRGALRKIAVHARGIPRIINILCENALITAMGYGRKRINARIVEEVIRDFAGRKKSFRARVLVPSFVAAGVIVCGIYLFNVGVPAFHLFAQRKYMETSPAPVAVAGKISVPMPENRPVPEKDNIRAASGDPVREPVSTGKAVVKTVRRGDTLSRLVGEVYGLSNRRLITLVMENNAALRNADLIEVGETIVFPVREERGEKSHE